MMMKTFFILVVIAAGVYFGWKYLNKIDIDGSTAKQAQEFDLEVKEQGQGKRAIENLPPSDKTASSYVAPVASTMEKLKGANAATNDRNGDAP